MDTGIGALFRYLQQQHDLALLFGVLIAGALLNALIAAALLWRLPLRYRNRRGALWLLLFGFGFFVPVVGTAGLSAALLLGIHWPARTTSRRFASVEAPKFSLFGREEGGRDDRGLRARVAQPGASAEARLKMVVALQHVPAVVANPILQDLLGDRTDDVRVVAFGMLDSEEKNIAQQIHRLLLRLKHAEDDRQRYGCQRMLAELFWELAYSGMVQGDLRRYTLERAYQFASAARAYDADVGLMLLLARIHSGLGRHDEAETELQQASDRGLPATRALPYLAECAYKRHDFAQVRSLMAVLDDFPVTPRLLPVVRYWNQSLRRQTSDD